MDEAPASERGELWTRRDNFFSRATRDGEHTPRKKQKKPLEQAGFFLDHFHIVGYRIYQYFADFVVNLIRLMQKGSK